MIKPQDSLSDIVAPNALRRLNDAVYQINMANGHADLSAAILSAMGRLVHADTATFHALHRETGKSILRMAPQDAFTTEEIACFPGCHKNACVTDLMRLNGPYEAQTIFQR